MGCANVSGGYNPVQMALISGNRLGPYEILSPLGADGMGELYRARDVKLRHDVALKVLSSDPTRLRGDLKPPRWKSPPNGMNL